MLHRKWDVGGWSRGISGIVRASAPADWAPRAPMLTTIRYSDPNVGAGTDFGGRTRVQRPRPDQLATPETKCKEQIKVNGIRAVGARVGA